MTILQRRLVGTPPGAERFEVLGALLEAACPDGIGPGDLTRPQREAVRVMLETSIWADGRIARQILAHYRLPADGDQLRALATCG